MSTKAAITDIKKTLKPLIPTDTFMSFYKFLVNRTRSVPESTKPDKRAMFCARIRLLLKCGDPLTVAATNSNILRCSHFHERKRRPLAKKQTKKSLKGIRTTDLSAF